MAKGLSGFAWIIIILVALYFINPSIFPFQTGAVTPAPSGQPSGGSVSCPSTLQTTVKSVVQNPLSGTLSYEVANLTVVEATTGDIKSSSDFTTGGSTKSYSTGAALTCGKSYTIYTMPGSNSSAKNFTSCSKALGVISGDTSFVDINCPNSTQPLFAAFTTAYANETGNAANHYWIEDGATTTSQTMGQNSVYTFIVRYAVNSTYSGGSQFGNDELGTYVCADYDLTAFSLGNGVTVDRSDWVVTELPKWCSNAGYDKAWRIPAIKTSSGERDVKVTLTADLGNPSNDVRLYFVDSAYYVGNDGKVHSGTTDDAGNDLGQTNRYIDLNIG